MPVSRTVALLRRLRADRNAAAIVEIGLSMPVLMGLALAGVEVVNLADLHVRLNQLSITVADNASRAKQAVIGNAPRMREYDVNQVFTGASLQVADLDFPNRGRVILSSLQTNSSGGQWIQWQRCWGSRTYASRYGVQGTGASGTSFAGMGPVTSRMTAETGTAIMFVEVAYQYRPLFFTGVVNSTVIRKESAVYVRDDRDLTQIYNPAPTVTASTC